MSSLGMFGKVVLGLSVSAAFMLSGCDEDHRHTDEKLDSPAPNFNSRQIMACPKCGAPTSPFRISQLKSYYHCSGQPPKFPYHEERAWEHTIQVGKASSVEH